MDDRGKNGKNVCLYHKCVPEDWSVEERDHTFCGLDNLGTVTHAYWHELEFLLYHSCYHIFA